MNTLSITRNDNGEDSYVRTHAQMPMHQQLYYTCEAQLSTWEFSWRIRNRTKNLMEKSPNGSFPLLLIVCHSFHLYCSSIVVGISVLFPCRNSLILVFFFLSFSSCTLEYIRCWRWIIGKIRLADCMLERGKISNCRFSARFLDDARADYVFWAN